MYGRLYHNLLYFCSKNACKFVSCQNILVQVPKIDCSIRVSQLLGTNQYPTSSHYSTGRLLGKRPLLEQVVEHMSLRDITMLYCANN